MSSSRPTTDPSILLLLPSNIRSNGAIDEEINGGGTTDDRAGGCSTLRGLSHPVGLSRGMTIAYAHRSIDSFGRCG